MSLAGFAAAADGEPESAPDAFILLKDTTGPFVTRRLAERLAVDVIEEKFPRESFAVRGAPRVADRDTAWAVTVENAVPLPAKSLLPRRLTILISKASGEIVGVS